MVSRASRNGSSASIGRRKRLEQQKRRFVDSVGRAVPIGEAGGVEPADRVAKKIAQRRRKPRRSLPAHGLAGIAPPSVPVAPNCRRFARKWPERTGHFASRDGRPPKGARRRSLAALAFGPELARASPCRPLASASLEHSIDLAECAVSRRGGGGRRGAGEAVWAKAAPPISRAVIAAAIARVMIFMGQRSFGFRMRAPAWRTAL